MAMAAALGSLPSLFLLTVEPPGDGDGNHLLAFAFAAGPRFATCEECVKNTKCLWCSENTTCMDYPVSRLIPPSSLCELKESYWGICFGRQVSEEEERFIRDREEKRMQSLQRKHERKVKHDEIRKKYGLLPDSDHPYSRYENE
ncbi:hypothetical protein JD844_003203 [Phrynosoma platyrhinos]|uniref:PSI domain-containing protein n=1 Tax=Phrynosoma platyrhinos TaxID=52577 RepID=A0ABQ7TDA5_PHRPL|nr:hypothetical protein JD844_003203 [Phrynosoma platyrhinos]